MKDQKNKKPDRNLLAWQKPVDLAVDVYRVTESFPKHELYGLTSQMRRAAVSVPSNIAEGASGRSKDQFKNFLSISIGSLNELSTQLEIAKRIGYLSEKDFQSLEQQTNEGMALTHGLKKSLQSAVGSGQSTT